MSLYLTQVCGIIAGLTVAVPYNSNAWNPNAYHHQLDQRHNNDAYNPSSYSYEPTGLKYDRNAVESSQPGASSNSNNEPTNSLPNAADALATPTLNQSANQSNFDASTSAPSSPNGDDSSASSGPNNNSNHNNEPAKSTQLQRMVQQLYMAQGQVQLEAAEIQRAQTIASSAQQNLEDAANNVRVITAALRAAQETVANAALRAQTAQLQLAAHDQLLFTARQKVDALSAQMVGLQAELGIVGDQNPTIDVPALLQRLRAPLPAGEQPKAQAIPAQEMPSPSSSSQNQQSPHPMIIHSAPSTVAIVRSTNANTAHAAAPAKRSTIAMLAQQQPLTAKDVHQLLSWVRRAKDDDVARATAADDGDARHWSDTDEMDDSTAGRQQRYVDNFVANMRHLGGARDGDDERRAIHRRVNNGDDRLRMMDGTRAELAQRNADLIRRTVRSVARRHRRQRRSRSP